MRSSACRHAPSRFRPSTRAANVAPAARPGCAVCGAASSSATATNCTYSIGRPSSSGKARADRVPVASRACAAIRKNAANIKNATAPRRRIQTAAGTSPSAPMPQKSAGGAGTQMPAAAPATIGKAKPTAPRRRAGRAAVRRPGPSSSIHVSTPPALN